MRGLLSSLQGNVERVSMWSHPTTKSEPNSDQLARFPLNDIGLPYAPVYTVLPAASPLNDDIPEQMVVGSPPREQLYL